MRPLPPNKNHAVIHTVTAKQEDLDKIADALGIHGKARSRLRPGEIHIVREAADHEMSKDK